MSWALTESRFEGVLVRAGTAHCGKDLVEPFRRNAQEGLLCSSGISATLQQYITASLPTAHLSPFSGREDTEGGSGHGESCKEIRFGEFDQFRVVVPAMRDQCAVRLGRLIRC